MKAAVYSTDFIDYIVTDNYLTVIITHIQQCLLIQGDSIFINATGQNTNFNKMSINFDDIFGDTAYPTITECIGDKIIGDDSN